MLLVKFVVVEEVVARWAPHVVVGLRVVPLATAAVRMATDVVPINIIKHSRLFEHNQKYVI